MGKIRVLAAVGVLAAVPALASAAPKEGSGPPRDKATGGGQAFLDTREPTGAGDTVAFTAQRARGVADSSTAATGQVQVNRRGTNAVKFHGIVDCLVVNATDEDDEAVVSRSAGDAYISGYVRGNPNDRFELYVQDGGSGQMERNDMIALFAPGETADNDDDDPNASGPCGFDESPSSVDVTLARGNVQVRNASTAEDQQPAAPSGGGGGGAGLLGLPLP